METSKLVTFEIKTEYLHRFQDAAGNRFKWKTASELLEVGKSYSVKGTVKQHETYVPQEANAGGQAPTGIKQTNLSRCVATEIKEPE